MFRNSITGLIIVASLCASGCATSSPIQRASESKSKFREPPAVMSNDFPSKDIYRIFHQGSTGFVSVASIRESAMQRAEQFARSQGKSIVVLGERISQPPYILGNFPRIEIVFAVDNSGPSQGGANPSQDKYTQIERIKKLLDQGAITQQEFDQEKAKILK